MAECFSFDERLECPACASNQVKTVFVCGFDQPPISNLIASYYQIDPSALRSGQYKLDQCLSCSTIYQAEVGDRALLTALYSKWVLQCDQPESDPEYAYAVNNPWKSRDGHEIITASAWLNMPLRDMATLDYGMGWAGWSRVVADLGCQSFGSDIAEERRVFASKFGITALHDHEIGIERFDFINTEQAMEHMTDVGAVMENLSKALKPGGLLKISVPSQGQSKSVIQRLNTGDRDIGHGDLMPIHPLEHVNTFTMDGLTELGKRFGLVRVRPNIRQSYAFLARQGTMDFKKPTRFLKELIRPFYQYRSPTNLYVWLHRPR